MNLTKRIAQEIISHEAIVREAYKDSVGVWTWSVGVTNASGHQVHPRYKDNPQSLERCLEVFEWVLRSNFLPDVLEEFAGHALTENQLGGALSFHYNTGGIKRATWADQWKAGQVEEAYHSFMWWDKPPEIIPRREKERDLFFDGMWSSDGTATEYPVSKPSYTPNWSGAKQVDIGSILDGLFGEVEPEPEPDLVSITLSRNAAQELYEQLKGELS